MENVLYERLANGKLRVRPDHELEVYALILYFREHFARGRDRYAAGPLRDANDARGVGMFEYYRSCVSAIDYMVGKIRTGFQESELKLAHLAARMVVDNMDDFGQISAYEVNNVLESVYGVIGPARCRSTSVGTGDDNEGIAEGG